jgi:aryl-alcohol dehydrogenase-like predicted oxidoreductase
MIRRMLGRTGIEVSLLGLGTVKFGRNEGVGYPHRFELPSERDLARLLDAAHDLGIDLLDTAPAYGRSEERLGRLLHGRRQRWVLSTKVGEEFADGASRFDFSAGSVRQSIERSLRRLRTDVIDVALVHSDGSDSEIIDNGETLGALGELKRGGLIRAFGMSHKTLEGGLRALETCDVVMTTYQPNDRTMAPVIERAAERARGVMVKKALASGHLNRDERRESLVSGATLAGVSTILVGTIDLAHLAENVAALSSVRV